MNKLAQTLDKTGIRDWDFLGEVGLLFKISGSTVVVVALVGVVVDFFELEELFKFVVGFSVKPAEGFSRGESCNKLGVEFFNPACFG